MNSSFHFPNFMKALKSTKAEFSIYDTPKPNAADPNKLLEASNSGTASEFSSPSGELSLPLSLNTGVNGSGKPFVIPEQSASPVFSAQKELIGATRDFIRQWVSRPRFFGTLTYRSQVGENAAKRFFKEFRRKLAKLFGSHLRMAWGEEYQGRNVFHHHFLVAEVPTETRISSSQVSPSDLLQLWPHGISEIREYDPSASDPYHGAELYLAKHENWDVDVACPRFRACRREDGCKVARSHW